MLLSGRSARRALVGLIGSGALAGATLIGAASLAFAQPPPAPPPPGCTAADLAQVSGIVGTAMGNYLFIRPDVNNFFTSLRGLQTKRSAAGSRAIWTPTPRSSRRSTGFANP